MIAQTQFSRCFACLYLLDVYLLPVRCCVCTCIDIRELSNTYLWYAYVCEYDRVCVCVCACMRACMYVCMCVHVWVHSEYTHAHAYV